MGSASKSQRPVTTSDALYWILIAILTSPVLLNRNRGNPKLFALPDCVPLRIWFRILFQDLNPDPT